MELIKSKVVFNEEDHSYFLDQKRLMGITGLIHSILGLGVYPEASEYVKSVLIPKAGSKGTAVHHAIQTYDEIGIKATEQTVPTTYYKGTASEHIVDEVWNVAYQLECYIHHLTNYGFEAVANEYTVSDNERYASQIDNVWRHKESKGIWLVDTKTNNCDLYPLCGYFNPNFFTDRKEALKEYLSWQLSVYAVLFEDQNPELKVEGLACNWLRENEAEFWVINRKPDELVRELLATVWERIDGRIHYFHHDVSVFGIDKTASADTVPAVKINTLPSVPEELIQYGASLIQQKAQIEAMLDDFKAGLRKAMEEYNVSKFDCGLFVATLSADTERSSFDSTRFKKENPEDYARYSVKKKVKGSFTIKAKEQ